MIDFSSLNNVCLAAFAEPVVFEINYSSLVLDAVFTTEQPAMQKDDVVSTALLGSDYYTLDLNTADVETHGIALRTQVTVRDQTYQVLDITHDSGGISRLKIRRYQ